MNTYIITYNKKWKTDGRKVRTRTTYGLTKSVVAPSAEVAKADFIADRQRPWVICRTITNIEEVS